MWTAAKRDRSVRARAGRAPPPHRPRPREGRQPAPPMYRAKIEVGGWVVSKLHVSDSVARAPAAETFFGSRVASNGGAARVERPPWRGLRARCCGARPAGDGGRAPCPRMFFASWFVCVDCVLIACRWRGWQQARSWRRCLRVVSFHYRAVHMNTGPYMCKLPLSTSCRPSLLCRSA